MLFYVYLPYTEEASEFKKLQNISPWLYWTTTFIFDMLVHTFVCVLLLIACILFDLANAFKATEYGNVVEIKISLILL